MTRLLGAGMCKWDDKRRQLATVGPEWPRNATLSLNGAHAVQRLSPTDTASALGQYIHYCNGYISSRVRADASSIADYNKFEILDPPPTTTWHCDTVNWNNFAERYVCLGDDGGECMCPAACTPCFSMHWPHLLENLQPIDPRTALAHPIRSILSNRVSLSHKALEATIYSSLDACILGVTVELNVHAGDKTVAFSHNLRGPYVNGTVVATHHVSGSSCYNAVRLQSL